MDSTLIASPQYIDSPTNMQQHDQSAAHAALEHYLSGVASGHPLFDQQSPPNASAGDFADLLAEFTLPNSMLSPEAMAKSPEGSVVYEAAAAAAAAAAPTFSDARLRTASAPGVGGSESSQSPEEVMLEHLIRSQQPAGATGFEQAGASGGSLGSGGYSQMVASLDPASQAQLFAALLQQQQQGQQGQQGQQASQQAQQPPPSSNVSTPQASHGGAHHSQPPSQAGSPRPFQPYHASPSPSSVQSQQHAIHLQQHAQQVHQHLQNQLAYASLASSLPPSLVSSPLASPYFNGAQSPFFPAQNPYIQQNGTQPNGTSQPTPVSYQNAFSPRPFVPQPTSAAQAQMAMEVLSRVGGSQPNGIPEGGAEGQQVPANMSSFSTPAEGEPWRESNEFMFSPLISPALTPQSVFTNASSLPPSASSLATNGNLISPADLFTGLGSPAILPNNYSPYMDPTNAPWPIAHSHSNSLQGLVDQTQALGFGSGSVHASPNPYQTMSPRLAAVGSGDAGQGTTAGSGRRGAGSGSRKARPSPLLKPTPDSAVRKKKVERRSSSIGSRGAQSAQSSPYLGATPSSAIQPLTSTSNRSGSSSGTKPSPPDGNASTGSGNAANTPSPVDLAMNDVSPPAEAPGLMGPPPPPSLSRTSSLQGSSNVNSSQPVTPASLMNLSQISSHGLTSGVSMSGAESDSSQRSPGSAPKPKTKKVLPKAPSSTNIAAASTSASDAPTSTAGSSSTAKPTQPSPASSIKGKARAGSVSGSAPPAVRKLAVRPAPKTAGPAVAPKLKPLLAHGVSPEAMAQLSNKSNYQNIMDGRGVDLLGLDPSTVSALSAAQGAGVDTRKTSHKAAEQKRRDSLKMCFEELRRILPPIAPGAIDEEKRPGEGNVGGQRGGNIDPENPNRGVSKAALLRRSNEYVGMLHDRIDRRDVAIEVLRAKLRAIRASIGQEVDEVDEVAGLDLDNIDRDEKQAGTMAFYEGFDSDDEDLKPKPAPKKAATARRKSNADGEFKPKASGGGAGGGRRSTRKSNAGNGGVDMDDDDSAMEVEGE